MAPKKKTLVQKNKQLERKATGRPFFKE